MGKTMTPSAERKAMTDGQLEKAVAIYRDMLRKHRAELASDAVQQVLGSDRYLAEITGVLRRGVEAVSDLIVRHVKVDRNRTPQEAIVATGRNRYVADEVVTEMPRGKGEEVDVYFFKLGRLVSDADLEKEYELRGLVPADPYSLAAVNEDDPSFADDHPNATHWKNTSGKWSFAAFRRWSDGRSVSVYRVDDVWFGSWCFGGLRK